MNSNTKSKLEYLSVYVSKRLKTWQKKYNIVGVYIGNKIRQNSELRYYSIVFQVQNKEECPDNPIPSKIKVVFKNKEIRYVPTDVIEAENFEFRNLLVGDKIKRTNSMSFGTVGVFLRKHNRVYACSNMHVLANELIQHGKNYYYKPIKDQMNPDVVIGSYGKKIFAYLERCVFNGIDAGIARIQNGNYIPNIIRLYNAQISGYRVINWANYKNFPVKMSGFVSGKQEGYISNIEIDRYISNNDITLKNLIKVNLYSQRGDSGSPVFDKQYRVIGIVVGGTPTYSYLVPIVDIMNFFNMYLLT